MADGSFVEDMRSDQTGAGHPSEHSFLGAGLGESRIAIGIFIEDGGLSLSAEDIHHAFE